MRIIISGVSAGTPDQPFFHYKTVPSFYSFFEDSIEKSDKLARQSDIMIIVGKRKKPQIQNIFSQCARFTPTFHVEHANQLHLKWFKNVKKVGISIDQSHSNVNIEAILRWIEETNDLM